MRAASEWVRTSREGESRLAASMNLAAELVFAGKYEDAMVELGKLAELGAQTTLVSTLVALETARVEMMLGGYASAEASFREIVNALVLLRSDGRSDGRTLRRAKGLWAEAITLNAQYSVTHGADGDKRRARAFDRAYRMLTALAGEIASEIASEVSAKARERALRYEAVLTEGRAANTLLARGDEYDALVRFEGAIEDAAWLGDECPLVLSLRHGRALCLARLGDDGDVDDAEREMRGVVSAYTTMYSADHPLAVRASADLASIAGV